MRTEDASETGAMRGRKRLDMPARAEVASLNPNEVRVLLFVGDGTKAEKDGFTDGRRIIDFAESFARPFLHFQYTFELVDRWKCLEQPKGTRANKFALTEFGERCYEHYSARRDEYGFPPLAQPPAKTKPATKPAATSTATTQDATTDATAQTTSNATTTESGPAGDTDGSGTGGAQTRRRRPHRQ